MALTKSAKKSHKRSEVLRERNLHFKKAMKLSIKTLKKAVVAWDKDNLNDLLKDAYSSIDRAAKRNLLHSNNAARKKSSLTKLVSEAK